MICNDLSNQEMLLIVAENSIRKIVIIQQATKEIVLCGLLKMDNLNLIISDFVSLVFYVPLPAWNEKKFLLRSVFL